MLERTQIPGFTCEYSVDTVRQTAAAVDFSLVASGSATLEVASSGCPMVVMYQTNRVLWQLVGRWLVHPKFFTLVNLLADRELVPEFMPYFTSIEPIVAKDRRLSAGSEPADADQQRPDRHGRAADAEEGQRGSGPGGCRDAVMSHSTGTGRINTAATSACLGAVFLLGHWDRS